MNYRKEYERWINHTKGTIKKELEAMDEALIEDAFYQELTFGTGGLRGTIGAGTNRMNTYVVARASQGLANYLRKLGGGSSVVIGYDSRINSDIFAKTAASVIAANNLTVLLWPELNPVPTVSFAVRYLGASGGIMITASHNPSQYNGFKVYGSDGCQITTDVAKEILNEINTLDIFSDVKSMDFDEAMTIGRIKYIEPSVLTAYIEEVKRQSVLYDDEINRDVAIVYTPLNGTGLIPVTRVLAECGFTNITVVEEQRDPDGRFPTCPYPNPEIREAMELGLRYCEDNGADILMATDPDADRCGIAIKDDKGYRLISGNEVGILLLDFICSQREKHGKMPTKPIFIKTIVTTDLSEKIANHYGIETINVLTGFKYIGEQICKLEKCGRESDYICGFEESYGYLTGAYIRDKDAVNAAFMICEMFAFYKTRGISLITKLDEIYSEYGYCLNTLHSFEFEGSIGLKKMQLAMDEFRINRDIIGGTAIIKTEDYFEGLNGLPAADVLKFFIDSGFVVVRPSGTEPKLKVYISIMSSDKQSARILENCIITKIKEQIDRITM